MNNIEKIKFELRSLDTQALYELLYNVSDEIISNDLNDLLSDFLHNESQSAIAIARMVQYGDCKVEDDYFLIDAYGNLQSYTKKELKKYILDNWDTDIAEYLIENPDQLREYLNI